ADKKSTTMKKQFLLTVLCFAAIAATSFAQGFYIEFKITSSGKEGSMSGAMKTYYQDGNSRADINMTVPQLPGGSGISIVSLTLKDTPDKVFMLDEKNKSYTEIDLSSAEDWKDAPPTDYEVTVIGKENVNGYNTIHVKVLRKGSKTPEEFWNTTEVAGYQDMAKIKTKYTGKDNLMRALEAKGAGGFPVRVKTTEQGNSIQIDLVKAEKKSNPASLFSLNGYTKSQTGTIIPAGIDVQQMMKDMQNMTPEEREKWIQEMQKQYEPR
ncbi:MAG TPA: DUF4412 domain-containing protein, partial [Chitinophagales bacterium]|nr:DUF4412 domain-containing protein [Chitinophagales bacterium]